MWRARPARGALCLALGALALLAAGCNAGAYPLDIFSEMHYTASQRRLQPQRLAAPADAVPVTGARPRLTWADAATLTNPQPQPNPLARGGQVYALNCAACHGPGGKGDGPVAAYFRANQPVPPADLTSERVRGRTDGQLYWIISNGLGNMPPFRDLLSEQDTWATVALIRALQQAH